MDKDIKLKGAVIIIGSLLWDTEKKTERKKWQQHLLLTQKQRVRLPIRYGRFSSSRSQTYSMVFSNKLNLLNEMGMGYVVPFKEYIAQKADLLNQVTLLSKAEGFDKGDGLMFKSWGTVCIAINPFTEPDKARKLVTMWRELVTEKRAMLSRTQRYPNASDFGEADEEKSIDEELKLKINLDELFRNELKEVDFLLATSNAIKHSDNSNRYPTPKEIAQAMFRAKDYSYFLMNRFHSIKTQQDRVVSKILRIKCNVSLKKELSK
ncbi:hypothetical protein [Pedobacter sp. ASV12]|uniref:hypothetical protein n=1 Tax=Pedobacter sp. ASV12 TaxID=2795120 RepID=UPI0018ED62BE|nr:hypothetical protein [Pedobacter sp. ASV12]